MNSELAKQLKDHGFPQKLEDLSNEVQYKGVKYQKPTEPTLSELIEACGDKFESLDKIDGWTAYGIEIFHGVKMNCIGEGSTHEEAVARLWLELNAPQNNEIKEK
jgi:hypothetical protein